MTEHSDPRSRRWTGLLRLMVQVPAVLVVAIGGWLAWVLVGARIQHNAVAAIEKAGGSVVYDWELRDTPLVATPKPPWLEWLVDHLGVDCFGNVTRVDLGRKGGDPELAQVANLTRIDYLNARGSAITDSGLVHLRRLTRLRELRLDGTAVTDAGLAHLRGLTALRVLDLSSTRVTDAGIPFLERLGLLERLNLWRTRVSEAGVRELKRALSHLSL